MKPRLLVFFLTLAAFAAALYPRSAQAQDEVNFDYFYDSLSPYGEWIEVADYGLCWRPTGTDADWAPYTDGYWAYTDGGWTWVSYEDYGGLVYHYGRWSNVRDEGWVWVPDYEWGPAWVSWRNNDDYVGWAPLPPEARFTAEIGVSTWVDDTYDIGPDSYRFCRTRDFGSPVIREVCLPWRENVVYVRDTVNITNITIGRSGFPFCGGPRYDYYSSRSARPIPALKIVQQTNIVNINNVRNNNNRTVFRSDLRGNTLVMPAPRVRPGPNRGFSRTNIRPVRTVAANRVDRGWDRVAPEERRTVREKVKEEAKGGRPDRNPARAVDPAELKAVPVKADPEAKVPGGDRPNRRPGRDGDNNPNTPNTADRPGRPGDRPDRPGDRPNGDRPGKSGKPGDAPDTTTNRNPADAPAGDGRGKGNKPGKPGDAPDTTTARNPADAPAGDGRGKGNKPGKPGEKRGAPDATPTPTAPVAPTTRPGDGDGRKGGEDRPGMKREGGDRPGADRPDRPNADRPGAGNPDRPTGGPGNAPNPNGGGGKKGGFQAPDGNKPNRTPGGDGERRETPRVPNNPGPGAERETPRPPTNPGGGARREGGDRPDRPNNSGGGNREGASPARQGGNGGGGEARRSPETVRSQPRPEARPEPRQEVRQQPRPQAQPQPRPQAQPQPRPQAQPQPRPQGQGGGGGGQGKGKGQGKDDGDGEKKNKKD